MKIRNRVLLVMAGFLFFVTAGFTFLLYTVQSRAYETGIDTELRTAATLARELLPPGYHDRITGKDSVSDEEYLRIVDRFNRLCVEANLEYLWSLMVLDGKIVFTSGTSPSKDARKRDQAEFLEVHSNPGAYTSVFTTMQPQSQVITDKWGRIRAVLVPFRDARGRPYLMGASRSMQKVDAQIHSTLVSSIMAGGIILFLGTISCLVLASSLAHPIEKLTKAATQIAGGNLLQTVQISGIQELEQLGASINSMSRSIRDQMQELERRVEERTTRLTSVNRELEAFSYSVSHDLRAPLRSINGFSTVILEKYFDKFDADGKDYLHRIIAASERMAHLIDDLLKLSRITRNEIHLTLINLSGIAEAIARELNQNQGTRQAEFIIQPDLYATADENLIRIVLQNLFSNAWKFTRDTSPVRIEFGMIREENQKVFFVRDNGAGFDMTYVDKLFGAFQRLHRQEEFEGSGIGLATVQRIIHRHNGRVWAKGEVGKGATFYFTIP